MQNNRMGWIVGAVVVIAVVLIAAYYYGAFDGEMAEDPAAETEASE